MIEIENLTKNYGQIKALNDISLTVKKGEVLGFLGPNGAGKSTTMNIITGFIPFTEGTVKICGHDILTSPLEAKKHLGYLPEHPPLYLDMTVLEFLNFVGKLKSVDKKSRKPHLDDILELTQLKDVRNRIIKNLSKGYRQRVGLAQALVGNPDVIILDEPTAGLDPKQIIEIRSLIKNLGKHSTVILSSHILPEISAVCERVVIINRGEIVARDTPENLSRAYDHCSKVKLTVEGSKSDVENTLSSLEGVSHVEVAGRKDENITSFLIESAGETDLKRKVSQAVARSGHLILELKSLDISLEEIFLQIVTEEKEVNN